jgi:hypothetical protein
MEVTLLRKNFAWLFTFALFAIEAAWADACHVLAFRFKPGVSAATKADFARRFVELKDSARRAWMPYIVSTEGGRGASHEGFDLGFEYAFVVSLKETADRNFFVGPPYLPAMDPAYKLAAGFGIPQLEAGASGRSIGIFAFDFLTAR